VLISGVVGVAVFWNRSFDALLAMQSGVSAPLLINQLGKAVSGEDESAAHLGEESLREQTLAYFRY
jgi:hypothetical protein